MNLTLVARLLSRFTALFSLAQVFPLLLALGEDPARTAGIHAAHGLGISIAAGLLAAAGLAFLGRGAPTDLFRRESLLVVGLAWILAGVSGSLPFVFSGALPDPIDATFETISGLTTCGASVLGSGSNPAVAALPPSLHLWRSGIQWLGGLGIVLVFVTLLPALGVIGRNLLAGEQGGVNRSDVQPRLIAQARVMSLVYLALTAACILLLWQVARISLLDSVCHAFTAMATGGFSTRASIAAFDNRAMEVILGVFMFLAGCNFAAMATAVVAGPLARHGLLRTAEFRLYAVVTAGAILCCTVDLIRTGRTPMESLGLASFNVVSVLTCCGYASADFQTWPSLSILTLFGCMIVGGCTGSTAGGFKILRLQVCLSLLRSALRQFVNPRQVQRLKLDGEVLTGSAISAILTIVLLWLLTIFAVAMVIALDQRMTFLGALSTSATMLGCCGPAMTTVDASGHVLLGPDVGPFGGFADLAGGTKLVLIAEMILGRLELLAPLALFTPGFWRRP